MKIKCIKDYNGFHLDVRRGKEYRYKVDEDGDIRVFGGKSEKHYQDFVFKDSNWIKLCNGMSNVPFATDYFDNEDLLLVRLSKK